MHNTRRRTQGDKKCLYDIPIVQKVQIFGLIIGAIAHLLTTS